MKRIIILFIYLCGIATGVYGQIPEMLNRMIEKYPSANRRVWYYFDHSTGTEYYRTQFSSPRHNMAEPDVKEMTQCYLAEWDKTDFIKATGGQYRSPDSLSITIKGNSVLSYDAGKVMISADWGREVPGKKKWHTPEFGSIVSAFSAIKKGHRAKNTNVCYTGFPAGILFVFHRGSGMGLTKGERTTVYNVTIAEYEKVRRAILNYIGRPVPVTVFDRTWQAMIKSETTPDFYAVGYNPESKTLNFLHATVEKEICIPYDWQTIDRIP